jgi:hypothetical protein
VFERLEPVDWKLSNPVLRGRRAGNSPLQPDQIEVLLNVKSVNYPMDKKRIDGF